MTTWNIGREIWTVGTILQKDYAKIEITGIARDSQGEEWIQYSEMSVGFAPRTILENLGWENYPAYGIEPYARDSDMARAAELIGATFVAAHYYSPDCNIPYPAFERDGKVAYISFNSTSGLEPQIMAILSKEDTSQC